MLFDVSKPINDTSFFEIEKSTIHGQPYQTGGGRTVNANVVDIMLTWMVNNDREFMKGGATGATQSGLTVFPYEPPPNMALQAVADSVDLSASPSGLKCYWAVWRYVASLDRQGSTDWRRCWSITHNRSD
jgi:hypothetical protein